VPAKALRVSGRPAVYLDRDGVLNDAMIDADGVARIPMSVAELQITATVEQMDRLREQGYLLVVVTNQPDIGRGLVSPDVVDAMHDALRGALPIDAVYCCPHGGSTPCPCRKPAPGMILQAAEDLAIDLERSWLIGDRWVDISAAKAAGVQGVLLERPYSWAPTSAGSPPAGLTPSYSGPSLDACIGHVLGDDHAGVAWPADLRKRDA
jgi:D-glycero-D-manno-heptose 1,7-bisphosphate phosphatase